MHRELKQPNTTQPHNTHKSPMSHAHNRKRKFIAATKRLFPLWPDILRQVFGELSEGVPPRGVRAVQGAAQERNSMERIRRVLCELAPEILSLHQTAWLLNSPTRAVRQLVRAGLLLPQIRIQTRVCVLSAQRFWRCNATRLGFGPQQMRPVSEAGRPL